MATPGYRASDSVRVFFARTREELLEPGKYEDFFDLKNTFLSFTFTPPLLGTDNDRDGMYKLVLINPSLELETKLFSMYKTLFSRSSTLDRRAIKQAVIDSNKFYVRWGYTTGYPNINGIGDALSHIHYVQMNQIDYNLTEGNERTVTIRFSQIFDSIYKNIRTDDAQATTSVLQAPSDGLPVQFEIANTLRRFSAIIRNIIQFPISYGNGYEVIIKDDDVLKKIDSCLDDYLIKERAIGPGAPESLKKITNHYGITLPPLTPGFYGVRNTRDYEPLYNCLDIFYKKFNLSLYAVSNQNQKLSLLQAARNTDLSFEVKSRQCYFGISHPLLREFSILLSTINLVLNSECGVAEPDLLRVSKLEYSLIPDEYRDQIAKKLGKTGASQLSGTGAVIVSNVKYMREIFSWADEIKSFQLQAGPDSDTVVLTHGFPNRPNNIITDINLNYNNQGFFAVLMDTPVAIQSIYSIAKRFSNPAERLKVVDYIAETWSKNAYEAMKIQDSPFVVEKKITGPGVIYTSGIEYEGLVGVESTGNSNALFNEAVLKVSAQTAEAYSTDTRGETQSDPSRVRDNLDEDLFFIINDPLLFDIFFPLSSNLTYLQTTFENNVPKSSPVTAHDIFRTMAATPLQSFLGSGNVSGTTDQDLEAAAVLLAKIRQLRRLKAYLGEIQVETLGIPEMDTIELETSRRQVVLEIAEPREPGNIHWATGVYFIKFFSHVIDNTGYRLSLGLVPKPTNDISDALAYIFRNKQLQSGLGG